MPYSTTTTRFSLEFFSRISTQKKNRYHRKLYCTCIHPDSFPVPTYLFFKGDERLGRNDVKVAGQAGKGGLPLMQFVLVKTASGATGNESGIH